MKSHREEIGRTGCSTGESEPEIGERSVKISVIFWKNDRTFFAFLRIWMKLLSKLKKKMQFDSIEKGEQKREVFVKRENGDLMEF